MDDVPSFLPQEQFLQAFLVPPLPTSQSSSAISKHQQHFTQTAYFASWREALSLLLEAGHPRHRVVCHHRRLMSILCCSKEFALYFWQVTSRLVMHQAPNQVWWQKSSVSKSLK